MLWKGGRITFRGGRLNLERWSPDSGCVKRKNQFNKAWVRIVGLPLHLWTCDVLRMIGDGCGGYLATDKETTLRTDVLLWARILVKVEGKQRPSIVNILSGSRSYEFQLWRELPPWVAEVFPSKGVEPGLQLHEGDEWSKRAVQCARSGRKQSINDGLTSNSGMGEGKSGSSLFDHNKTERGAVARDPRMGCDPTVERNRCQGSDPLEKRIRLDYYGLEASQDGLSPPTHQIVSSKGLESKAHASGPGRLEEAGSCFNTKPRALLGLSYNGRGGKEHVLALSNTSDDLADLRYDQSQDLIPSTSSPSVLDRLHPLGEFFGWGVAAKRLEEVIVGGMGKHL